MWHDGTFVLIGVEIGTAVPHWMLFIIVICVVINEEKLEIIMNTRKFYPITLWLAVFILMFSGVIAQEGDESGEETSEAAIDLTGSISRIDGSIVIVSGLPIDISGITVDEELSVGLVVSVSGVINEEGIIIAQALTIIGEPTPVPEVTETPEPETTPEPVDPDTIIVIQGPVQNININIITIYNIDVTVEPQNPILSLIEIGDMVRIEGFIGTTGVITATLINTLTGSESTTPGASVGIQGPIERIDGNRIVVNGITVQLDPNDPLLPTLVVGNFIDVQGNFVVVNNVYVLSVVNFVIINNAYIGVPASCWWHGMGGMGHWHCDGMGMGMGMEAMGMGMGMGN